MDTFNDIIISKFQALNNSQNSIQSTSQWIISHKSEAKDIVKIWYKEFRKANAKKKLAFLYLANDVIQNGRKKAPQFSSIYQAVLPVAFKETAKSSDKKTKDSLLRLVKIWRERNIYKRDFLEKLKSNITRFIDADEGTPEIIEPRQPDKEANEVTQHVSHRDPRIKSQGSGTRQALVTTNSGSSQPLTLSAEPVPVITESTIKSATSLPGNDEVKVHTQKDRGVIIKSSDLLEILNYVQNPPSIDEVTRRTIASFQPQVSDPQSVPKIKYRPEAQSLLDKVRGADTMLVDYNGELDTEMTKRKELSQLLKGWLVHQNDAIRSIKNKLLTHQEKLEKAKVLRETLNSHLSKLPELVLAPKADSDVLNPLPSVDELFN